jgi:trimeric autotransporter adhesin
VASTNPANLVIFKNSIGGPVIDSLNMYNAPANATVTINGKHFNGTTAVAFGGVPASSFTIVSDNKLTAVVGGGASGNVTITNPAGTGSIPGFTFTPSISYSGTLDICGGQTVTLTSSAISGNQWYRNGLALPGATGTTYPAAASGSYTVKTTSNGITTTSTATVVTVNTPPVATITQTGGTLTSSETSGNQWYLNNVLIPGATQQTFQPAQAGGYTVRITANGCLGAPSATYNYALTAIPNTVQAGAARVFPNPVNRQLVFEWNGGSQKAFDFIITDMHGRKLLSGKLYPKKPVDLQALPKGSYSIRVENRQLKLQYTMSFVKQ